MFFCTESFLDGQASSTLLVYFSAVLGISVPGSTFERARNYTPKLSALIYCVRLCLLEATLPRFAHPALDWPARPPTGQLKMLERVRARYLCLSCPAPMGELLSLRAYGRTISRSDGPSFRVSWSDDGETVSWHDGELHLDEFRQLGRRARELATASVTRLMYGLDARFELEQIHDRFSTTAPGYSFVQDSSNQLAQAYLDLSRRACLDRLDGLMSGDRWNYDAVHRYLTSETELLQHIMLICYLAGGQAPRSTELFSLECWNGPSTCRGIYLSSGSVVYVTRHCKARRSTNREFQVARFLPSDESRLVATYLIYIRPFAEMLRRVCFPQAQPPGPRRILFSSLDRPDRPWTTAILTKALKALCGQVCRSDFGIQIYRQLSIAITEKHLRQISRPFNRYDDRSADADLDVGFAWQSGHRPLQRGTSYGIDGAFPDSLQPSLLRVYRWVSEEWHRFLSRGPERSRAESTPSLSMHGRARTEKRHSFFELEPDPSRQGATSPRSSKRFKTFAPWADDCSGDRSLVHRESADDDLSRHASESYRRPPPTKMDPFRYYPDVATAVCRECRSGVFPIHFDSHLRNQRHRFPKAQRDATYHAVVAVDGIAHDVDELAARWIDQPMIRAAIPDLPVYSDGVACQEGGCRYICRAGKGRSAIRAHYRIKHQWANPYRGGGGSFAKGDRHHYPWRDHVWCQRLFDSRAHSFYFEIIPSVDETNRGGSKMVGPSGSSAPGSDSEEGRMPAGMAIEQGSRY